jgi:hypothetical protein
MKFFGIVACLILSASAIVAQGALGTITGTVADPSGAVVGNASIEIKNTATGQVSKTVATATGNYTVSQLPVGSYELTVTVTGFKTYKRSGLDLAAAQIMRIDIPLEVGSQTESVTVTAEASLLKTESGDLTHNVTATQLAELPILATGGTFSANTFGARDPLALARLMPGVQYGANGGFVVNGMPDSVFGAMKSLQIRVEGQTSGDQGFLAGYTAIGQASVDAVQEVAVQTSNYAAEYGAAGAVVNMTMKSGTNQLHGTATDFAANEVLNAYQPYTGLRSPTKRHDYSGTIGGPLWIPKVYDGRNKTFLFFSFEEFREDVMVSTIPAASGGTPTVPTDAYRNGNFAQVITGNGNAAGPLPYQINGKTYVDPLGRSLPSGTIFNPTDVQSVTCAALPSGVTPNCNIGTVYQVRNPFPSNQIPSSMFDPVALRILNLVPKPVGPNFTSGQAGLNYQNPFLSQTRSKIPSVKGDQSIGSKHHISFYGGGTLMDAPYTATNGNAEGFPSPITGARSSFIYTKTYRLNWDYTLTPTLLLHLGAGWYQQEFNDTAAATVNYNASAPQTCTNTPSFGGLLSQTCTGGLGLNGAIINRQFPRFVVTNQGFGGAATTGTGGMNSLGPFVQGPSKERRPSGVASATWVRGNHTYKAGGEWRLERYPSTSYTGATGQYTFDPNSTLQTALDGVGGFSTGSYGFGFASFLRGDATNFFIEQPGSVTGTKKQMGLFLQDTWKVTRKLTVDYGLRWDYATYGREENGIYPNFSATTPNPSAGGHPGAQIYEQTCNCHFASNYPYAIGPRIGVAYQINSKTVLRGGFGVVYAATVPVGVAVAANTDTTSTPGFGQWVGQLQGGIPSTLHPIFPNLTPNAGQGIGAVGGAPPFLDPNSDRPARQYQYSFSVQRELNRNLVLEASWVGNRGVWWPASALTAANAISVGTLAQYGFTVGNPADAALLTPQIGTLNALQLSTLAARGVNLPYSNFPKNQTVLQSLYPFPQYLAPGFFGPPASGPNLSPSNAPLGKTWYDSLQLNLTKRFSHGLTFNGNYTYSKNLDLMSSPDIFNRDLGKNLSANDLPHQLRASIEYNTPRIKGGNAVLSNKIVSNVLSDWTLGTYLQYQSAPILARPNSSGLVPINQYLGRGPGPAQLAIGPDGNPMNPWSVDWTDYSGVHHTDPIDINCHCFDPTKTQVLNPKAWVNVPDGQWANNFSSLRYYRGFRYPTENLNFGRTFRIKERVTLNVRVEFANAFNRTQLPQPNTGGGPFQSFGSLITTQTTPGLYQGAITGGFGSVVPITGTANSRTGLFVGRLQF